MVRLSFTLLLLLTLGCDGTINSPLDGTTARQDGQARQDQRQTKQDRGQPKQDRALPKQDKGQPKKDKGPPPNPCKPLPKGCRCAAACKAGKCDNTRCPCLPIAGVKYGTISAKQISKTDPAKHVDVNLLMRQRKAVSHTKGLVKINGPTDKNQPPQLYSLFVNNRVPAFSNVYQVQNWSWGCNCFKGFLTAPEVTLAGMVTKPGEVLRVPKSAYNIGGGRTAMVLYAAKNTITLKYTGEDNVVYGYTVHLSGVCVEPALQKLYDQCHAGGRKQLPALAPMQPLGRAMGQEVQAAIRDTGAWMDPRSRKDWWQGK